MGNFIGEAGNTYGRLTVLEDAGSDKRSQRLWSCICECGNKVIMLGASLRRGDSKSCGCLRIERFIKQNTKHGMHKTKIYQIWEGMISRCNNKNDTGYKDYGGRGINICKEWMSFENFYKDIGDHPGKNLTLDRKNNDKGYSKENCRWATPSEQMQNRRVTKMNPVAVKVCRHLYDQGRSIVDLAKAYNIHPSTMSLIVRRLMWKNIT